MRTHDEPLLLPASAGEVALARCAAGELPPNVALAQLCVSAHDHAEAEAMLMNMIDGLAQQGAAGVARLRSLRELWRDTPQAFRTIKAIAAAVDHDGANRGANIEHWAKSFDRAAEISASAGVALYCLGRTDLLDAATQEIVDLIRRWNLLQHDDSVLDLGCGHGRIVQAIAPVVRLAVGVDVSSRMLNSARQRCPAAASLVRSSGNDLAAFAAGSFDLVCAVDVFPYLFASNLAATHVHEAARVLKRGGHLVIFNFSYRGSDTADRVELANMARTAGLSLICGGTREFRVWDGLIFLLQKGEQRRSPSGSTLLRS